MLTSVSEPQKRELLGGKNSNDPTVKNPNTTALTAVNDAILIIVVALVFLLVLMFSLHRYIV